ncbi:MAG: hypothetical protein ACTFAK_04260 [Candidatus Electronema sp. VV]
MAAWTDDFMQNFNSLGMYDAVKNALAADVKPQDILDFVKKHPELDMHLSMKALYCAGQDRDAVGEAGRQLGLTEDNIGKALSESIKECGSTMALTDRDIPKPSDNGNISGTRARKGGVPADGGTPPAAPPASGNASGKSKEKKTATPSLPPMPPVGPPPSPSQF